MAVLTAYEQLLLELVNRARLDPNGEAARYGISLNQGLTAGTLNGAAKQVLAPNELLTTSARNHSQWMINTDIFSHSGAGGSDPHGRMMTAGYNFTSSWTSGENIAWSGTTGTPSLLTYTAELHQNLFKSAGHRVNILNGDFRELGTGVASGVFTDGRNWNAVMATENFAKSGTAFFITGVAINDTDGDNFYDVGEGRAGINVAVSGAGSDATAAAGGYAQSFAGGTVNVTFSGGGLASSVTATVAAGAQNAKVDLAGANEILSSASVTLGAGAAHLTLLGVAALRGTGNEGANVLIGNKGGNILQGLGGNDLVCGGLGRDLMSGGAGIDRFDFNFASESIASATLRDQITDFLRGTDKVDLSTIDAHATAAGNQAFKWIATQAFHKVAGELHYVRTGASVVVEGDVNGDGRADFQIQLNNTSALAAGDFIL